jgi:hypothetical protein
MLDSPAYRVLSLSAHRIMSRIEVELGRHGGDKGKKNGILIVTYDDFCKYGIDRHAIGPAISELEALGFIEVKEGSAGNAIYHGPNTFRLTFRHAANGEITDGWRRIASVQEAQAIAKRARSKPRESRSPVGRNTRR